MGLDLMPRKLGASHDVPAGMTHQKDQPCPFKDDEHPVGMLATCCSYRGNGVALYLVAMGLGPLALDLFRDHTPEEAIEFAKNIRAAAKGYEHMLVSAAKRKGHTQTDEELIREATMKVPDVTWEPSLAEALNAFRSVAAWHERVGSMGFGVHAWF
jgi:hypothetical protein